MVRQSDDQAFSQGSGRRILNGLPGPLLDDLEDTVRGAPDASSNDQPVSDWATGFKKVTLPLASVVITASPMLESVTRSQSCCSCNADRFGSGSCS